MHKALGGCWETHMTTSSNQSLSSLIRSYRRQIQQAERLKRKSDQIMEQLKHLNAEYNQKKQECTNIKNLIDHCVITGESPAEALLKHTPEQIRKTAEENEYTHTGSRVFTIDHTHTMMGSGSAISIGTHNTIDLSQNYP